MMGQGGSVETNQAERSGAGRGVRTVLGRVGVGEAIGGSGVAHAQQFGTS